MLQLFSPDDFGFIAAALTTTAFLPQVIKTWQRKKAEDIEDRYLILNQLFEKGEIQNAIDGVYRVKQKSRDMRKVGLESDKMEFSAENIAFKILRRAGVLENLSKLKYNAYDQSKTMDD